MFSTNGPSKIADALWVTILSSSFAASALTLISMFPSPNTGLLFTVSEQLIFISGKVSIFSASILPSSPPLMEMLHLKWPT